MRIVWIRLIVLMLGLMVVGCGGWTPFPPAPTATPPPTVTPQPTATRPPTAVPPTATRPSTVLPPTATVQATVPAASPTAPLRPTPAAPTPTALTAAGRPVAPGSPLAVPSGAVAGGRSAGDPKSTELGNTGYDTIQYTLQLRLDARGKRLAGSATLAMRSTLDRLGQISLDLVDGENRAVSPHL